jgi:hypothetical protein
MYLYVRSIYDSCICMLGVSTTHVFVTLLVKTSPLSEMMQSYKCCQHVSKMSSNWVRWFVVKIQLT